MIRPKIELKDNDTVKSIYPPLQWNGCMSRQRIASDIKNWFNDRNIDWTEANVTLMFKGNNEIINLKNDN